MHQRVAHASHYWQQNQELLYNQAALNMCYYAKIIIYIVLNETIVILKVFPLFSKCNYNLITTFFDVTVTDYSYWIFVSWLHNGVTCIPLLPNPGGGEDGGEGTILVVMGRTEVIVCVSICKLRHV